MPQTRWSTAIPPTATAWTRCVAMSSATSSSGVSGAQVMIPGVMTSATVALRKAGRR
jgi:hypothetical protein